MPLMYAFVARGQDVLCEYAAFQGNFRCALVHGAAAPTFTHTICSKVAVECLAKCPAHNAKFTYNADKHTFNFIVFNGYSACRPLGWHELRQLRRASGSACFVRRTGPARRALTRRAAFLCVADEEYGRQIPFGFLEKVKDDFIKNYGETGRNAVAMSLNRVYG